MNILCTFTFNAPACGRLEQCDCDRHSQSVAGEGHAGALKSCGMFNEGLPEPPSWLASKFQLNEGPLPKLSALHLQLKYVISSCRTNKLQNSRIPANHFMAPQPKWGLSQSFVELPHAALMMQSITRVPLYVFLHLTRMGVMADLR